LWPLLQAGTVGSALALRSHTQPPLAQPLPRLTARQPPVRLCRSSSSNSEGPGGSSSSSTAEEQQPSVLYSVVPLALWAGLMGYVFLVAPNQTPGIDSFVVQKLVGCVRGPGEVWGAAVARRTVCTSAVQRPPPGAPARPRRLPPYVCATPTGCSLTTPST
jgi:hypothetical protein